MRRGAKRGKAKVKAKRPAARKPPKKEGARVRDLEKRLAESLDQQTATAEILRVISGTPADAQPVFDTIVRNAGRVCDAVDTVLSLRKDNELIVGAHWGPIGVQLGRRAPLTEGTVMGRTILHARPTHVADLSTASEFPEGRELALRWGHRTTLGVPLLREGKALGSLLIRRTEIRPFSDAQIAMLQTFADQAVIAIENVRMFNETKEALEQQTAAAEILRVISSSPTDTQPVFDMIAENAQRLCDGHFCAVFRFDGELIHLAGHHGLSPDGAVTYERGFPLRPGRDSAIGRAILDRALAQIPDVQADPEYGQLTIARAVTFRAIAAVPMLRDEQPVGGVAVSRSRVGPFSDKQLALLQTFADQAVIAIENARLLSELQQKNESLTQAHAQVSEALEQQMATSEVLRVISRSPTNIEPVFEVILRSAVRLSESLFGVAVRYDGRLMHLMAHHNLAPEALAALREAYPAPLSVRTVSAGAIERRQPFQIEDAIEGGAEWAAAAAIARHAGNRASVSVPMLRDGEPIGAIALGRPEPGRYSEKHVAMLQTFADQAVIAIENVRLFTELEERNRDVTEALEQQTATSEVLKVISRSTFNLQAVLDTLIESATRLCRAEHGYIFKFDGQLLHPAADYGAALEFTDYWRQNPIQPGPNSTSGRAALEHRTVHIHDVTAEPNYRYLGVQTQQGFRTVIAVPMLREDTLLGVITMWKTKVEPFTDTQVELLTTFADQAVIAIENVRLFTELEARTAELTLSVEELRALGEVSRAVSSTLDLPTVLATIVARAVQLSGTDGGVIYEYDEATQTFGLTAAHHMDEELVEVLRVAPIRLGEGATGQAAASRTPIQVPDILDGAQYGAERIRSILERLGYRSVLAVPLLLEQRIMGTLTVWRLAAGAFNPEIVNLLQTFATQSALAIQNARLFREIADKSAQLEAASRHKSEFLANMSHELRTPLNAIIGFSEVLVDRMFGELNEKQDEYLKDIYASGQHLLSLINDILDLAKVEAGRMELEWSEFDLPSALDNALILVRERASRRGIGLGSTIDPGLGMIGGDERKVKQVLLNLLSNALKFTPEGGRIDVGARGHDGVAEVSVADTGVGIAPADQEAVFEEFRQVGAADKKSEGTGLGLALARKFIELHGGKIWVTSQVGAGSTFTFTLPLQRPSAA